MIRSANSGNISLEENPAIARCPCLYVAVRYTGSTGCLDESE